MEFQETKINEILLLDNYLFKNKQNDADFLNEEMLKLNNPKDKLEKANLAISLVTKFHSFFHFEQSYFHLELAKEYYLKRERDKFKSHLKLALFQDPNNVEATQLQKEDTPTFFYKRPYSEFNDYIEFASNEKQLSPISPKSYWLENDIEEKVSLIKKHHLAYHEESAKFYINRALIFKELDLPELSNNDFYKARDLNEKLFIDGMVVKF